MDQQDAEHGLSALMMNFRTVELAECVAILLEAGATHTLTLPEGITPTTWAKRDARWLAAHNGHTKVERVFAELVGGPHRSWRPVTNTSPTDWPP